MHSETRLGVTVRKTAILVRVLLIANFAVMLVLIGPGRSHELDLALRRAGLEGLIGRSIQVWIVGSTVIATTLFLILAWKRKKILPRIRFEGMLLIAWWVALLGVLAYGFMLGLGG